MTKLSSEQANTSPVRNFLSFQIFAMPMILQLLFWGAVAGDLYGTWWLFTHDNWAWVMSLTFGLLLIRVLFEHFILRYKTYQLLKDIRDKTYEAA